MNGLMHYSDVIMSGMASQITGVSMVCWTVCSGVDQRNIKALRHWPLWGELTGDRRIPSQRTSNLETVFICWRYHVKLKPRGISFANNFFLYWPVVLKLCTNTNASVTWLNDWNCVYGQRRLLSQDVSLTWVSLHRCHNDRDGVSNHQPHSCLLNRLFRRRSKKTSTLRVTGLCAGNSPGPVNSPHKGPVTRKMFPFDDVIM